MITEINITFPVPVNLPDGFGCVLSSLVGMVCEKYERENPERIMWAASHGFKPIFKMGNIVEFQQHIYSIECEEREDLNGTNPHGSRRAAARQAARDARDTAEPPKV